MNKFLKNRKSGKHYNFLKHNMNRNILHISYKIPYPWWSRPFPMKNNEFSRFDVFVFVKYKKSHSVIGNVINRKYMLHEITWQVLERGYGVMINGVDHIKRNLTQKTFKN